MPLNQDYREGLRVVPEGYELPDGMEYVTAFSARIDEGYLDTMEIQPVRRAQAGVVRHGRLVLTTTCHPTHGTSLVMR